MFELAILFLLSLPRLSSCLRSSGFIPAQLGLSRNKQCLRFENEAFSNGLPEAFVRAAVTALDFWASVARLAGS